jgi:hypothetical protein
MMRTKVFPAETTALAATAACLVLLLVTALAAPFDDRTLAGAGIWAKPMKFAFSLALHIATLLWLTTLLDAKARGGLWARGALVSASCAALIEILYIALQAARGRASHFNSQTPLEAFMYYNVMGPGAVVLVAAAFVLGVLVLRAGRPELGAGLRLGAALGAMAGSVTTLLVAGAMSTGAIDGPGHWVGGPRTDAHGLPLFGWSTRGGDLRVPHFFATHLMQALPAVGLMADRLRLSWPRTAVGVAAFSGLAIVALTFLQALAGRPFIGL